MGAEVWDAGHLHFETMIKPVGIRHEHHHKFCSLSLPKLTLLSFPLVETTKLKTPVLENWWFAKTSSDLVFIHSSNNIKTMWKLMATKIF